MFVASEADITFSKDPLAVKLSKSEKQCKTFENYRVEA